MEFFRQETRNSIRAYLASPKRMIFTSVFLAVLLSGVFFRIYHFSDWLHFETDQADDYLAVAPAVTEGWEKLPLVGPKAAGTDLRLGPAFYEMEFIAAKIFGNTPAGHAGATLFFSLLSLPLFYVTARLFFDRMLSLALLAVFATSPFLVLYGRFSWNPNLLPFFLLLLFFSLVRAVSVTTPEKKQYFLMLAAAALAITMQLHVSALLVVPACTTLFLLWRRPRFSFRAWIMAFAIFLLVFSPTLFYEGLTHGQTVQALTDKMEVSSDKNESDVMTKFVQAFRYHAGNYFLILTGHDAVNASRPNGASLGLHCFSCKAEAPYRAAGYVFLIMGFISLLVAFLREKDQGKKNFLAFVFLWAFFSFCFLFSIMISGKYLYPRFFLLIGPVPILLLGLLLRSMRPEKSTLRLLAVSILVGVLLFVQISTLRGIFFQMEQVTTEKTVVVEKEDIFPNPVRITLAQQERVADFIADRARRDGFPVYLKSESEYEPSLWVLLRARGVVFTGPTLSTDPVYTRGLHCFVFRSASSLTKEMKLYMEKFSVSEEVSFGALTLRILQPKEGFVTEERQTEEWHSPEVEEAAALPKWEHVIEYFR